MIVPRVNMATSDVPCRIFFTTDWSLSREKRTDVDGRNIYAGSLRHPGPVGPSLRKATVGRLRAGLKG